ncbi:hypothetical protein T484DRAFT_1777710, partial [Baffinella frigidus]
MQPVRKAVSGGFEQRMAKGPDSTRGFKGAGRGSGAKGSKSHLANGAALVSPQWLTKDPRQFSFSMVAKGKASPATNSSIPNGVLMPPMFLGDPNDPKAMARAEAAREAQRRQQQLEAAAQDLGRNQRRFEAAEDARKAAAAVEAKVKQVSLDARQQALDKAREEASWTQKALEAAASNQSLLNNLPSPLPSPARQQREREGLLHYPPSSPSHARAPEPPSVRLQPNAWPSIKPPDAVPVGALKPVASPSLGAAPPGSLPLSNRSSQLPLSNRAKVPAALAAPPPGGAWGARAAMSPNPTRPPMSPKIERDAIAAAAAAARGAMPKPAAARALGVGLGIPPRSPGPPGTNGVTSLADVGPVGAVGAVQAKEEEVKAGGGAGDAGVKAAVVNAWGQPAALPVGQTGGAGQAVSGSVWGQMRVDTGVQEDDDTDEVFCFGDEGFDPLTPPQKVATGVSRLILGGGGGAGGEDLGGFLQIPIMGEGGQEGGFGDGGEMLPWGVKEGDAFGAEMMQG